MGAIGTAHWQGGTTLAMMGGATERTGPMRHAIPLLLAAPLALAVLPAAAQGVAVAEQACANGTNGNGACTLRFTAQPGATYRVRLAMVAGPSASPGMMATVRTSIGACGREYATTESWMRPGSTARFGSYTHPRSEAAAVLCAVVAIYRCGGPSAGLTCRAVVNLPATKAAIIQD